MSIVFSNFLPLAMKSVFVSSFSIFFFWFSCCGMQPKPQKLLVFCHIIFTYIQFARVFYQITFLLRIHEKITNILLYLVLFLFFILFHLELCLNYNIFKKILILFEKVETQFWNVDLRSKYFEVKKNLILVFFKTLFLFSIVVFFHLWQIFVLELIRITVFTSFIYLHLVRYIRGFCFLFYLNISKCFLAIIRDEMKHLYEYTNYSPVVPLKLNNFIHQRLLLLIQIYMNVCKILRYSNCMFAFSMVGILIQSQTHILSDLYWCSVLFMNQAKYELNFSITKTIIDISPKMYCIWQFCKCANDYCKIKEEIIFYLHHINFNFHNGKDELNQALVNDFLVLEHFFYCSYFVHLSFTLWKTAKEKNEFWYPGIFWGS